MRTVFLCHAREDRQFSRDLTEFLERGSNIQVFLDDGEIGADETIVSKAADGLEAEVILLAMSHSVPARWVRTQWEPALRDEPGRAGVKVGTILAGRCEFPQLLRRESFFDATAGHLEVFREIKRWLLGLTPSGREAEFAPARQAHFEGRDSEIDTLWWTLADAPGVAVVEGTSGSGKTTLALEFARQSKRDFEGLVWLSCAGQSLAAIAGEMGSQLGMRLEGDVEQNVRDIISLCSQRRILVVLDDASELAGMLIAGGRSSTLLTTPHAEAFASATPIPIDPLDELAPRRALAALKAEHRSVLAAACACGDAPFRPGLLDAPGELLRDLIARGLMTQLDSRYLLCVTHSVAREAAPVSNALARSHAQAVNRQFAEWSREDSECSADLPQLRRALEWALSRDWVLARELSSRAVALLRRNFRQAEAFELLQTVAGHAEQREDRRKLEDCTRDQIWILESWDRCEEAEMLRYKRRAIYEDQMHFEFE